MSNNDNDPTFEYFNSMNREELLVGIDQQLKILDVQLKNHTKTKEIMAKFALDKK